MSYDPAPLSKTAKYKKITKPLLERKRRARINRCLDELKDLMVGALEIDDDNLSKLEKADILELTVNHLTKLHSPKDPTVEAKKFQAGFGQCAAEACQFIMSVPDLDTKVSQNLISHLSQMITAQPLTIQVPDRPTFSPPTSPVSVISDRQHYYSDHDRSSSDAEDSVYSNDGSRQWACSRQPPRHNKPSPPMPGLLTTVDKIPHYPTNEQPKPSHRGPYFNRVPTEAKDVILQKIRQHIMDKRGNEAMHAESHVGAEMVESKYLQRDETYRSESYYNQYPVPLTTTDTLDLRKVRSPVKLPEAVKETTVAFNKVERSVSPPEVKVDEPANVPECESPLDYSNLPPKKKRKLIEYQEYKKREEAKRQLDAYHAERQVHDGHVQVDVDVDDDKWRPW